MVRGSSIGNGQWLNRPNDSVKNQTNCIKTKGMSLLQVGFKEILRGC